MVSIRAPSLLVIAALAAFCRPSSYSADAFQPRVHRNVHRTLRAQGTVDLIVSFKDSTESVLESVKEAEFTTRGTKIANLVDRLEAHASTSQTSLNDVLDRTRRRLQIGGDDDNAPPPQLLYESKTSLWISNQVFIKAATFELVELLSSLESVSAIQEDVSFPLSTAASSSAAANSSNLETATRNTWEINMIGAPGVWAKGYTGQGVVVGTIDSGVFGDHSDLKKNFRADHGWLDPFTLASFPEDATGHGTHVMGTIAGANGIGVAPRAKWIACRACYEFCNYSAILMCTQFMMCPTDPDSANQDCSKAAHVVSNSWGSGQGDTAFQASANAWHAAEIIPVFSIGNDGPACGTAHSPGDLREVIGVGGTNGNDDQYTLTGKGPAVNGAMKPDISAPGQGIRSADITGVDAYAIKSGTSFAAPHVAGVVALLLSVRPGLTYDEVKSTLFSTAEWSWLGATEYTCGGTADSTFPNNQYGHGRVEALAAVELLLGVTPTPAPTPAPTQSRKFQIGVLAKAKAFVASSCAPGMAQAARAARGCKPSAPPLEGYDFVVEEPGRVISQTNKSSFDGLDGMSDVDELAELLTLIDQEEAMTTMGNELQPLATTSLSAGADGDGGVTLLRGEDLDPDVFPGPLDELLAVDESLFFRNDHPASDVVGGNYSSSDVDIVAALVLTFEERKELLSALQGEDDDDETQLAPVDLTRCTTPLAAQDDSARGYDMAAGNVSIGACSPSDESSEAAAELQLQQQQVKKPRRRKRQKDEMNYLEYRVRYLEAQLEGLQLQERKFTEETLVAANRFNLLPRSDLLASGGPDINNNSNSQWIATMLNGSLSRSQLWERIVNIEKVETRIAVLENMRLRAQYESQLQVAKRLEALYHNQFAFAVMDALPERGFLSKRSRVNSGFSDDAAIFASLGCDFDTQYAQTDQILASSGLALCEGEMQNEMQLKRDERGLFCLENVLSKVAPFDVHTIDRVFWHCVSNEQLQQHHGVYQIRDVTNDSIFTKSIDPLQLPNAEATTLTMWIAMKRYVDGNRIIAVCETMIEMTGSVSMRLREKSWNVLRPALSPSLVQNGPLSLVQTCVRMAPEVEGSFSAHDLAVGTLTSLIVGSYHRHKELMHQVAENLLLSQFTNLAL